MKSTRLLVLLIGLVLIGSASAADKPVSPVTISFEHPDKFTDIKDDVFDSDRGHDYVLQQLREHMERTALKLLAEGQHLDIKVTDIDLAGAYEPQRGPKFDSVRFMRDIYPPRMELQFKLTAADGKVVSEGKRSLLDNYYLMNAVFPSNDVFRYDKEMITDWMQKEFKHAS